MSVQLESKTESIGDFLRLIDENDPPTDYGEDMAPVAPKKTSSGCRPCKYNEMCIVYKNAPNRVSMKHALYSILQLRTWTLVLILSSVLVIFIFVFALIYRAISPRCGLGLHLPELGFSSSVMFSILVHFRSSMNPIGNTIFWDGCVEGCFALFLQLFVGNILMSVIISSLMLSFQSSGRRNQNRFNSVTVSRRAALVDVNNEFQFRIKVADTNIVAGNTKLSNCTGSVCLFSPTDSTTILASIVGGVSLDVTLPTMLIAPIPGKFIFPESHPVNIFSGTCVVCGKPCVSFSQYLLHMESASDPIHDGEYYRVSAQLAEHPNMSASELLAKLRDLKVQFLVIIEARDPATGNRILTKKVYPVSTHVSVAPLPNNDIRVSKNNRGASIYYNTYL